MLFYNKQVYDCICQKKKKNIIICLHAANTDFSNEQLQQLCNFAFPRIFRPFPIKKMRRGKLSIPVDTKGKKNAKPAIKNVK